MRIVMCDFDGVLNSHRFAMEKKQAVLGLDPVAVKRLDRLCKEGDAMVVVSSAWRYGHTLGQLKDILREAGFTGKVRDRTPFTHELANKSMLTMFDKIGIRGATPDKVKKALTDPKSLIAVVGTRGQEIDAWLQSRPGDDIESFVILDDDSDTDPHGDRHVKTDFDEGLLDGHVEMALKILAQPWRRTCG